MSEGTLGQQADSKDTAVYAPCLQSVKELSKSGGLKVRINHNQASQIGDGTRITDDNGCNPMESYRTEESQLKSMNNSTGHILGKECSMDLGTSEEE